MINAHAQKIAIRLDALNLRDRTLLLVLSVACLFILADRYGFQPVYEKKRVLLNNIEGQQLQLELLRSRFHRLEGEPSDDLPHAQLQAELKSSGQQLQLRLGRMLSPGNAMVILEEVMSDEQGLTLNAASTKLVPLASIVDGNRENVVMENISRYQFELLLEGGYLETLNYLRALEALPWKFFWTGISFVITDHPKANVELEVYTLGQTGD